RRLLLGLAPCSHLACPPIPFHRVGRPGASVKGTEILTGVLEATVRDPCRSGPGAKLVCGLTHPRNDRRRQATRPRFHACEASPRGIWSLSLKAPDPELHAKVRRDLAWLQFADGAYAAVVTTL